MSVPPNPGWLHVPDGRTSARATTHGARDTWRWLRLAGALEVAAARGLTTLASVLSSQLPCCRVLLRAVQKALDGFRKEHGGRDPFGE